MKNEEKTAKLFMQNSRKYRNLKELVQSTQKMEIVKKTQDDNFLKNDEYFVGKLFGISWKVWFNKKK